MLKCFFLHFRAVFGFRNMFPLLICYVNSQIFRYNLSFSPFPLVGYFLGKSFCMSCSFVTLRTVNKRYNTIQLQGLRQLKLESIFLPSAREVFYCIQFSYKKFPLPLIFFNILRNIFYQLLHGSFHANSLTFFPAHLQF